MGELRVIENRAEAYAKGVIERLEEVLVEAREGRIAAIAIAAVRPEGSVNTAYSETDNAGTLLGAIALLQSRVLRAVEEY